MSSRLEIEITSLPGDDRFTWRVVGAKQPKGEGPRTLLPEGTKVGDQFKAEADFGLDGIDLTNITPARRQRKEATTLEPFRTNPPSWSPPSWRRRVGAADAETTVTAVEAGDEAEKATVIAAVAEVGTTGVKVAGATTAAVAATVRIARRRPRCPPGPRQSGCAPERPIATRYWRRCRTSSDPLPIS